MTFQHLLQFFITDNIETFLDIIIVLPGLNLMDL